MDIAKGLSRRFTRRRGRAAWVAQAAGLGAVLMYFLDPDRGARRRALARDKSARAARRAGAVFDKGARDLAYRLRGLAAETRWLTRPDHPGDTILVERVRARIGRAVTHPHAIRVEASNGRITLRGPVLRGEVGELLAATLRTHGVTGVDDHLEPHDREEMVPALQGGPRRSGERLGLSQERWSPLTRVALGALGGGMIAYGLSRRDSVGLAWGAAGAALVARDVANRPIRLLLGVGAGRRAVDFQKTIHIHAPVEEVFAFFTRVENFPRFMSHVREVKKVAENRYRWTADGPAHLPVSWEAEVTEVVPNRRFAWRSVEGAIVGNAGVVRFEEDGEGCTRLDLRMCYNPPAGAVGHALAALFGADPKHALDEDMVRFQSLLTRGKTTAHHHEVRAEEVGLKER